MRESDKEPVKSESKRKSDQVIAKLAMLVRNLDYKQGRFRADARNFI